MRQVIGDSERLKKSTIIFVEFGMLAGIIVAGYTLPGSTSLRTFLIASGACFAGGNVLLFRRVRRIRSGAVVTRSGAWGHIFKALTVLAVVWLLSLIFFRR
jgi:hypothetical protein